MSIKTVNLKDYLYSNAKALTKWAPLKVGNCGPSGMVSSVHTGRGRRVAKASTVALALEKIIDGKIRTAKVSGQTLTYVEYDKEDGQSFSCITNLGTGNHIDIITENLQDYMAVATVYASLATNDVVRDELGNRGIRGISEMIPNQFSSIFQDEMFIACDAFYYEIGKQFSVKINEDAEEYRNQLKRIIDSGQLMDTETEKVKLNIGTVAKEPEKKKSRSIYYDEPLEDFFERCKRGEFIIDYEWNDFQKKNIVPLDLLETYIPTELFRTTLIEIYLRIQKVLERYKAGGSLGKIIGKTPINDKIMGKPGTGKSMMIQAVLASLGYPCGIINCKARMEEDEVEGLNKIVNGYVESIPTKIGELHGIGGAIILEEMNLPDPGILQGSLGQALENPYILKVDGYKEVERHPLTIYFGTMNIGTNGTQQVNQALSSRFPVGKILEDVPTEEFVRILSGSGYAIEDCREVYNTYHMILEYLRKYNEDLVLSITMRHCLVALELIDIGFDKAAAYKDTFISEIYSSDPEVAKDLESWIFKIF